MQIAIGLLISLVSLVSGSASAGSIAKLSLEQPAVSLVVEHGKTGGTPIPLNKLVKLRVKVKSKQPVDLTFFDASMPAHMHGMVTKPRIRKVKANEYEVSGVKLHMSGEWLFAARVADKSGKLYNLTSAYTLK